MILALLALASAQQVQLDQSLDLTLQPGAPYVGVIGSGNGTRGNAACDDFNRGNGPMSGNWSVVSGSQSIVNNHGLGSGTMAYMLSTTGNCAASAAKVSIEFLPSNGSLKYVAAMTGFPGASNGYFTKIQDQTGGLYANIGFYQGNNGGGYGGFWSITPVVSGRMDVSYDAASDSMRMDIDEFNDGSIDYTYYSLSGASGVGGLAGTGHGVGTYQDQEYDNWQINDGCGGGSSVVLTRTGTCPGATTLSVSGATPNGGVFMIYGPAGSYTRNSNPCAGLTIPISQPTLAGVLNANGSGNAGISFNAPVGLCGRTVVAVDAGSCQASNAITL